MATVDYPRNRIIVDETDYAALDELVAAGARAGLIGEHVGPDHRGVMRPCVQDWHRCYDGPTADEIAGEHGSSVLRARGEAKGNVGRTAKLPTPPAAHASPGAQSRGARR